MKPINLYFCPAYSDNSEYIQNIVNKLGERGIKLVHKRGQEGYRNIICGIIAALKYENIIIHFNFIENAAKNSSLKSRIKTFIYLIWIDLLKVLGAKICWTMHNNFPHNCKNIKFSNSFYNKLLTRVDTVFIHCHESKDILINKYNYSPDKICYIPHGNFIKDKQESKCNEKKYSKYGVNDEELVYLHFSTVLEYKNVPMLIDVFNDLNLENAKLIIAGKIKDGLENIIIKKVINKNNIILVNKFISEEEIDEIFNVSNIAVLPYKKESMLNSGVLIMSFSKGKPVIVSEFGVVKDIKDKEFVLSYNYNTNEEHYENLKQKIKESYDIFINNKNELDSLGAKAFQYAKEDLNWEDICSKMIEKYSSIVEVLE